MYHPQSGMYHKSQLLVASGIVFLKICTDLFQVTHGVQATIAGFRESDRGELVSFMTTCPVSN